MNRYSALRVGCDITITALAIWFFVTAQPGFSIWGRSNFNNAVCILSVAMAIGCVVFMDFMARHRPWESAFVTVGLLIGSIGEFYDVTPLLEQRLMVNWRTAERIDTFIVFVVAGLVTYATYGLFFRAHPKG